MELEQFYSRFAVKNSKLFDCMWDYRDYRQAVFMMARHLRSTYTMFVALDDRPLNEHCIRR